MQGFGAAEGQRALSLKGLLGLGDHPPVSTRTLSQLDKIMGNGIYQKGAVYVREGDFASLGMDDAARDALMQALGFAKMPAITVHVPVKPVAAPAKPEPAEIDVYAWASPDVFAVETPAPVEEAVAAEVPAAFVEEERIGWRPRRPDGERPQHQRPRPKKPQHAHRTEKTGGEGRPHREGRPEGSADDKPHHKHGKGKKPHPKGERPAPKPAKEPYINPYSPFAILREKLNTR